MTTGALAFFKRFREKERWRQWLRIEVQQNGEILDLLATSHLPLAIALCCRHPRGASMECGSLLARNLNDIIAHRVEDEFAQAMQT